MNDQQRRIRELEQTARDDGFTLAMPAASIVKMEDRGCTVDLVSGAVAVNGATVRYAPTGKAVVAANG